MSPADRLRDGCVTALEDASAWLFSRAPRLRSGPPEVVLAALRAALVREVIAPSPLSPEARASLYASLLALRAERHRASARLTLSPDRHARHARGAFYTPPVLSELLLDAALDPLISRCLASPSPDRALLSLRVLDPACGTGHLLLAVAARLARALASLRPGASLSACASEVAAHTLYGVDIDPTALSLARAALPAVPPGRFYAGDALSLDAMDGAPFDLVVGNPPFQNAIDGDRGGLRTSARGLRGTADLAYHFLAWALAHRAPEGFVAMVQPRALLSAPSARALRADLQRAGVAMLYAPDRSDYFVGARAVICAVAVGPSTTCVGGRADAADFRAFGALMLSPDNWWRALRGGVASSSVAASSRFEVRASMTAAEAYALKAAVRDAREGDGPKLVTTGLIDAAVLRWGERTCRYLSARYAHPRVERSAITDARLARRAALWGRPKVLVAGLASRVEAVHDAEGACAGAVGTWSITHPTDDRAALSALTDVLNADAASEALEDALGATRMGRGSITLTRAFLESLVG